MVQSVSPPSGSLVADFEGVLNATTFHCNVTDTDSNQLAITEWSVQNFREINELQAITSNLAPNLFLVTGNELPSNPAFTLNNILTIHNLTSELDGVILYCGTGQKRQEANFTLRIYRMLPWYRYSVYPNYISIFPEVATLSLITNVSYWQEHQTFSTMCN